jgi:hypothetical protein
MWNVGVQERSIQGLERKNHLENLDVNTRIILKLMFRNWDGERT